MNATTVVAYAYQADLYTPLATIKALQAERRLAPAAIEMDPEEALRQLAEAEALDEWEREDSNTFPQPVFADQLDKDATVIDWFGNHVASPVHDLHRGC
jgi:hypothetical protein